MSRAGAIARPVWTADPNGRGSGLGALALSLLTAGGAGLVLWKLWWAAGYPAGAFVRGLAGHGPDPLAWPRLLAVWLPLGHVLFAVAYWSLARGGPALALRRHFVADQLALGLVLPLGAILLLLHGAGPWRVVVGAGYVVFVAVKTALFVHAVWRQVSGSAMSTRAATAAVFLAAFLPYLLLDGYVATAISTSGDEPYYLLEAHSLLHHQDTDLADEFASRAYLPFYWGTLDATRNIRATPGGGVRSLAHTGLQPFLLLPGYALAGRVGAMATVSLLGAAALALAFALARGVGASPRAAFLAWLGGAFSVPIVSFAGSPWPEMPGAFFVTLGAAGLLLPAAGARGYARAGLALAALFALKNRFLLALGPLMLGFARRLHWRAVVALAGAGTALLLAAIGYDTVVSGGLFLGPAHTRGLAGFLRWAGWMVAQPLDGGRGLLGFLFDQEHGVLLTAPVFVLALAGGVVAAAERRWRVLLVAGGPFVATWYFLGGISSGGVPLWFAGFNPPARYLVATLPLLLVFVALALDRVRGRLGWSLTLALYALTLAHAVVLSIWPAWRFQENCGRAAMLTALWEASGLDAGRLLPTYLPPGRAWLAPGILAALLLLALGWWLARRAGDAPWGRDVAAGVLVAALAVALPLGFLRWHPWGTYPAAVWEGSGGTNFRGVIPVDAGDGVAPRELLVWAAQRDGHIEVAPRLPRGRYRLVVRAGAQAVAEGPVLTLQAGAEPPHRVTLQAMPAPAWREREYTYEVRWGGGRLPVRIALDGVGRQPVRLAYLTSLAVTRLGD